MDGLLNPHDILAVQGMEALQRYLVNAIQEVYRLQGVHINDKHIEVIVRQMLRWVRIKDVGDTDFLLEEQVDRFRFADENARVETEDGQLSTAEPLLLGITKASLSTESFISAASFQDDPRADRGGDLGPRRLLARLEGERDHGPPDPRRHRHGLLPSHQDLHDPTMKDRQAEEMDDTQSYIEQMVAATGPRGPRG